MEMKAEYQKKIKSYLLDRTWYKLVDCLEEQTNFWSYGRDFTTMPTYNTYVPTRTHILNKPDMLDADHDDLGYQFNLSRVSPMSYHNTLKGYKMMPKASSKVNPEFGKPKFVNKWRRLSNPRMQGFSTAVQRIEEDGIIETTSKKETFLQGILKYSSVYDGTGRR